MPSALATFTIASAAEPAAAIAAAAVSAAAEHSPPRAHTLGGRSVHADRPTPWHARWHKSARANRPIRVSLCHPVSLTH